MNLNSLFPAVACNIGRDENNVKFCRLHFMQNEASDELNDDFLSHS